MFANSNKMLRIKYICILLSVYLISAACSVKRPIIQAPDEDGYYNTDNSLNDALLIASKDLATQISSHISLGKRVEVVTLESNKTSYQKTVNEVTLALLNNGIKTSVNRTTAKSSEDLILTVYPTIYGIESIYTPPAGCVIPPLRPPNKSGRQAKVTIYSRLEDPKTGQILSEKEFAASVDEYAELKIHDNNNKNKK